MPKIGLDKIKAKREKIAEQLAALAKQEKAELDRRAAIAGHAVMEHAESDAEFAAVLNGILDERVKKNVDRMLFDLPKREPKSPAAS